MKEEAKIVKDLTPELASKIYSSIIKNMQHAEIARAEVLHHMKQLRAQLGRLKNKHGVNNLMYRMAIEDAMKAIDNKIKKLTNLKK